MRMRMRIREYEKTLVGGVLTVIVLLGMTFMLLKPSAVRRDQGEWTEYSVNMGLAAWLRPCGRSPNPQHFTYFDLNSTSFFFFFWVWSWIETSVRLGFR